MDAPKVDEQPKPVSGRKADNLVNTSRKGDVELKEDELKRVSGGTEHFPKGQ